MDRKPTFTSRAFSRSTWLLRVAAGSAAVACAATGAWPACETSGGSTTTSEIDPGPTFGAEATVSIKGRGSVKSQPLAIDCPGTCFTRIVLDDPLVDGAAAGITLVAEASEGAHFVEWKVEALPLGVRARGPSQCSPMTRPSAFPSLDPSYPTISLPFGETKGTPPRGLEAECDAFTSLPLAYALTARFEEDVVDSGPPKPDAGNEVLFFPPSSGPQAASEIGLVDGTLYWRFLKNGVSGIASGPVEGGGASVVVQPSDPFTVFDVDRHVVFQRSNGTLQAIYAGQAFPITLSGAPMCAAVTSDSTNVYCRTQSSATSSYVYAWPFSSSGALAASLLHTLPPGRAFAADEQKLYFSREVGGFGDQATLESVPRSGDGGLPVATQLVSNQTAPRDLVAGASNLFWIDDLGLGTFAAVAAPKLGGVAQIRQSGNTIRYVAADSAPNVFWVGIVSFGASGSSIVKASTVSSVTTVFRSNLTGLGGLVVDDRYVYWTQSDGRVYRAAKP